MPRTLTDPNYDDVLEWQERVTDADGDPISVDVYLDAVDDGTGFTDDGRLASNVSWLGYSTTENTVNGDETELLLDFTADISGLTSGYVYRFEVQASDGISTTSRTFTLEFS